MRGERGLKPRRSAAGAPRRLLKFRILADDRHLSVVQLRRPLLIFLSHAPELGGDKRAGRDVGLASRIFWLALRGHHMSAWVLSQVQATTIEFRSTETAHIIMYRK